jgi:hypothetical protein
LKGRASGKSAPAVDAGDVVCAILDVKDKKRCQSFMVLACKAWSVETVMEVLLLQGEHKAKQKAVPALEMVKVIVGISGVLGSKNQAGMLKTTTTAAQMSDPAIRRAALEVLVAMHAHLGDSLLDACSGMMRPPILASLREMVSKSATPSKENTKSSIPAPGNSVSIIPSVSVAPPAATVASTPIRTRPPSQLPAPVIVHAASHNQHPVPASVPTFTVEHSQSCLPQPQQVPATAHTVPSAICRNPVEEWAKTSSWIESQMRALQVERQKAETLLRRCQSLEAENEELILMAKELESEATKAGPSVGAIHSMSIDELAVAETMHQEALAAIVQRKKVLVEEMARKSECLGCSKKRAKSTVLFPCRHVVCSGCGVTIKNCPDCHTAVHQRFELPENVHV